VPYPRQRVAKVKKYIPTYIYVQLVYLYIGERRIHRSKINLHMYLHTYVPTYICTYIHMYQYTYVPTYICTYIHRYLHT
jgi:hypothetical protein